MTVHTLALIRREAFEWKLVPGSPRVWRLGSIELKDQVAFGFSFIQWETGLYPCGVAWLKVWFQAGGYFRLSPQLHLDPRGWCFEGSGLAQGTWRMFHCPVSLPVRFFRRYTAGYKLPAFQLSPLLICQPLLWLCPFSRGLSSRIFQFSDPLSTGPAWLGQVSLATVLP